MSFNKHLGLLLVLAVNEPAFSQSATSVDDSSSAIPEVVVTAQRRSETLQRAAANISAVSAEMLEKQGVSTSEDLNRLVPALVVQPTGLSQSFFIRGVGAASLNSFQENAVAFNVNGIFYSRPTAPEGSFYDLQRIEVVKGPQGTLYGRNATAGAINLIPVAPKLNETSGNIELEYGSFNERKVEGAINLPLGSVAALRVAAQGIDRNGYLSSGYDDDKGWATRAQLLVVPVESWSLLLAGDFFQQGGQGVGSVLVPSPQFPNAPPADKYIGASDPAIVGQLMARTVALYGSTPPFSLILPPSQIPSLVSYPLDDGFVRSQFWGTSATLSGDIGFADWTTIAGYRESRPNVLTYAPGFPGRLKEEDDQSSVETRVSSKPGAVLGYVVGLFYFNETDHMFNNFSQGLLASTTYRPVLGTVSKAAFGQLTYNVVDSLRLVAGARYTEENKSMRGDTQNLSLFTPMAPFVSIGGALKYERPSWKAGVEYDLAPDNLLYANASTAFKAGGFYPSAGDNTYKPETLLAYAIGSKNRFFDSKLQINAEAFYWNYNNQQLTYVGPVESTPGNFAQAGITVNAGKAKIYGLDTDIIYALTRQDTISASVEYLHGRYDTLVYNAISSGGAPLLTTCGVSPDTRVAAPPAKLFVVSCTGQPTLNSPEWSANVGLEHIFHISAQYDLTFSAHSHIESSSWITFDYLGFQERHAYTNSDSELSFGDKSAGWSVTGFVNNIEDNAVLQGGLTRPIINATVFSLRPPRTYGIRAAFHF